MKICSKCKVEKPFEAFYIDKKSYDGHRSYCIECEKLRKLELKKNPLMQLERQIRSSVRLENKLLKKENKRLCSKCKEIFLIDDLVGGVVCKECSKEYSKEYSKEHKEKMIEYRIEYYEKNKEKKRKNQRKYSKKNKGKRREYNKEYYKKKKLEMQNNT